MRLKLLLASLLLGSSSLPALAQFGPGGPPAVGVVAATRRPMVESSSYVGRVNAVNKVDIIARVTAFVANRNFTEGAEVDPGALLYTLERAPFEADLLAKQAAVQQNAALLRNAAITLGRARTLLNTPAGQRSTVDDTEAAQASQAALLLAAQAQLRQSQINLDYTEIKAPFAGKLSRSAVTTGNVVSPSSGALATIVSQDPMYVNFPVPVRDATDLRNRYADKGGFAGMVIHVQLPDGTNYPITGKLDYMDPSVTTGTDTLTLRATIANPLRPGSQLSEPGNRDLIDGAFVKVSVEGLKPILALTIPRIAVMSDQQGSFVYIVDANKKVQIRRITQGQSTQELAVVRSGLAEGDSVITEGLQKVHPGAEVNPGPASVGPTAPAKG